MTHQEAVGLIQGANISPGGVWADLGAGSGRFSLALAELLGPEGTVYAIDSQISRIVAPTTSALIYMQKADFTQPLDLPVLDGLLMANSLHYVKEKGPFLNRILQHLRPQGMFLLIEYEMSRGNPWVPFPIPFEEFRKLAEEVGLSHPVKIGEKPSVYGNGMIYVAEGNLE